MTSEYIVEVDNKNDQVLSMYNLIHCKDYRFKRELIFPLKTGETIECGGRYHKPDWFCADGMPEEGNNNALNCDNCGFKNGCDSYTGHSCLDFTPKFYFWTKLKEYNNGAKCRN